uniref:Capsid protein VP1 n=2 Tax=Newlavirus TaxID=2880839 RepID=A0A9E8LRG1_9VIRU|nr:VP1 [Newlavirus]
MGVIGRPRDGWVPPGYKYLGPGNSLDKGTPNNPSDAAAQRHDHAYSAYQAAGFNPYFYHNQADENFIRETDQAPDWGGRFGNAVFRAKRLIAPRLDSSAETSAKGPVGSRRAGSLAGGKRKRPPERIWWNLAKKSKGRGAKRPAPNDPGEGPSGVKHARQLGEPSMDNGGGEPMEPEPVAAPGGGGGMGGGGGGGGSHRGGVGFSTGNFDNRTLWHFDGNEITITCYASRLVHLNQVKNPEYRCFDMQQTQKPNKGSLWDDDYHAQCLTPWSIIDSNAWGVWMTPADFQHMVCFSKDIRIHSFEQKINNIVIKNVTETGPPPDKIKVYNNDLTALMLVAEDHNNTIPFTPMVMRQETLGFVPWRPCNIPLYRYYLPYIRYYNPQGADTNPPNVTRPVEGNIARYQKKEVALITIENMLEVDMLRTGDDYSTGTFYFDCEPMPTHYHVQSTRMLGAPPTTDDPNTYNFHGKVQPEDKNKRQGWAYSKMTDGGFTEATTLRPFQVGHTAPEWCFAGERAGPAIQPALPAEAWPQNTDSPDAPTFTNMLTKTQYDMRHGGNWSIEPNQNLGHGVNRYMDPHDSLANQLRMRDKSWVQPELTPATPVQAVDGKIMNGPKTMNTLNTYGPFAAEDKPGAFYPWGMIWDKQPTTDLKPRMHTQAPFVCKTNVPGQLFVKLGLNLTDVYDDTKPVDHNPSIITFADFYWTGKLVFKAKPRVPHQTNLQFFYHAPDYEHGIPDPIGQFRIPKLVSRQIPKYMY